MFHSVYHISVLERETKVACCTNPHCSSSAELLHSKINNFPNVVSFAFVSWGLLADNSSKSTYLATHFRNALLHIYLQEKYYLTTIQTIFQKHSKLVYHVFHTFSELESCLFLNGVQLIQCWSLRGHTVISVFGNGIGLRERLINEHCVD